MWKSGALVWLFSKVDKDLGAGGLLGGDPRKPK